MDKKGMIDAFIRLNHFIVETKELEGKEKGSSLDFYIPQSISGCLSDIKDLLKKMRGE